MVLDLEDIILFLFLFGLTVLFYFGLVGGFILFRCPILFHFILFYPGFSLLFYFMVNLTRKKDHRFYI